LFNRATEILRVAPPRKGETCNHAGPGKPANAEATASVAATRSITSRSSTSSRPSYSELFLMSWHFASTRHTCGPMP